MPRKGKQGLKKGMKGSIPVRRNWKKKTINYNVYIPNTAGHDEYIRLIEKRFVNLLKIKAIFAMLFAVWAYLPAMIRMFKVKLTHGFKKISLFQDPPSTYVWVIDLILLVLAFNATRKGSYNQMWVYMISTLVLETLPLIGILIHYTIDNVVWLMNWGGIPYGLIVYFYLIFLLIMQYQCHFLSWSLVMNWRWQQLFGIEKKK